jgi:hypothetical protein
MPFRKKSEHAFAPVLFIIVRINKDLRNYRSLFIGLLQCNQENRSAAQALTRAFLALLTLHFQTVRGYEKEPESAPCSENLPRVFPILPSP